MNWELIIWLTGLMLFAYWLNYVMGSPLADGAHRPDPGAILARFPRWLAIRRLIQNEAIDPINDQIHEELAVTTDSKTRAGLIKDWKRNLIEQGREFFTWEKSLLCPICLHWWLTLIFGAACLSFNLLHAREDLLLAGFTYLLNHLFIRKIV
jgi:hypothetical protein